MKTLAFEMIKMYFLEIIYFYKNKINIYTLHTYIFLLATEGKVI